MMAHCPWPGGRRVQRPPWGLGTTRLTEWPPPAVSYLLQLRGRRGGVTPESACSMRCVMCAPLAQYSLAVTSATGGQEGHASSASRRRGHPGIGEENECSPVAEDKHPSPVSEPLSYESLCCVLLCVSVQDSGKIMGLESDNLVLNPGSTKLCHNPWYKVVKWSRSDLLVLVKG